MFHQKLSRSMNYVKDRYEKILYTVTKKSKVFMIHKFQSNQIQQFSLFFPSLTNVLRITFRKNAFFLATCREKFLKGITHNFQTINRNGGHFLKKKKIDNGGIETQMLNKLPQSAPNFHTYQGDGQAIYFGCQYHPSTHVK